MSNDGDFWVFRHFATLSLLLVKSVKLWDSDLLPNKHPLFRGCKWSKWWGFLTKITHLMEAQHDDELGSKWLQNFYKSS